MQSLTPSALGTHIFLTRIGPLALEDPFEVESSGTSVFPSKGGASRTPCCATSQRVLTLPARRLGKLQTDLRQETPADDSLPNHYTNRETSVDITAIVSELKAERTRIDGAIKSLEGLSPNGTASSKQAAAPSPKRRGLTAQGRNRLSELMKKKRGDPGGSRPLWCDASS